MKYTDSGAWGHGPAENPVGQKFMKDAWASVPPVLAQAVASADWRSHYAAACLLCRFRWDSSAWPDGAEPMVGFAQSLAIKLQEDLKSEEVNKYDDKDVLLDSLRWALENMNWIVLQNKAIDAKEAAAKVEKRLVSSYPEDLNRMAQ